MSSCCFLMAHLQGQLKSWWPCSKPLLCFITSRRTRVLILFPQQPRTPWLWGVRFEPSSNVSPCFFPLQHCYRMMLLMISPWRWGGGENGYFAVQSTKLGWGRREMQQKNKVLIRKRNPNTEINKNLLWKQCMFLSSSLPAFFFLKKKTNFVTSLFY